MTLRHNICPRVAGRTQRHSAGPRRHDRCPQAAPKAHSSQIPAIATRGWLLRKGVGHDAPIASKEQRRAATELLGALRRVVPSARLRIPVLSTLSSGIRTHGPERAHPVDQPLARRATSQLDDHVVGERCGRSVAPNGDSLGRGAEELRSPPSRLRPAGRNGIPGSHPFTPSQKVRLM